jgi:hypothetical protein
MKRYKITTKDGQLFCGVYPRQIDQFLELAVGPHRRTDEGFVYTDLAGLVACVEVEGEE